MFLPQGACCNTRLGSCSDTIEANCRGNYSTTLSCAASTCRATPAQQGSCCVAGTCTQNVPQSSCSAQGNVWRTDNSCAFCRAVATQGACCMSSVTGSCMQMTQAQCRSQSLGMAKWTEGAQCSDVCKAPAPVPRPSPSPTPPPAGVRLTIS
jgi:hypothetical protein